MKLEGIRTKIAHIGSTAVPGLAAKPTIDILLGLAAETDLDATIAIFQKLGYIYVSKYNDTMPFRRFFIKIKPAFFVTKAGFVFITSENKYTNTKI